MATANEELKSVVRNWITSKIRSTNDDYLASNDYVKFHRIEDESATSGVYSTILKDTDTSGQIEFVDTLDDAEQGEKVIVCLDENEEVIPINNGVGVGFVESIPWSEENEARVRAMLESDKDALVAQFTANDPDNADKYEKMKTITHIEIRDTSIPDKSMKVVGLNMFNDAIQSLESAVSSTTDDLKDYLKFSDIEASTEEEGIYHTVLSNDNAAGQIEFVDTLDEAEKGDKIVVLLDANGEECPIPITTGSTTSFVDNYIWNASSDTIMTDILNYLATAEMPAGLSAEDEVKWNKSKSAVRYAVKYPFPSPDKKIKVVGQNMFNAAISSLNSSISSLTASNTDNLKDYLKFSDIEESTEEQGVYHTILSNDRAAGQLEFIDTLDAAEQGEKVIVFLDDNQEVVPMMWGQEAGEFVESVAWTAEAEAQAQELVGSITNHELDDTISQLKEQYPDDADKYERVKTITHYDSRTTPSPDKKIKVVGSNMFNALTSRVSELENRLRILISAFEADPEPAADGA